MSVAAATARETLSRDPETVGSGDIVEFLLELFEDLGEKGYEDNSAKLGEAITQKEHALQSAVLADQLSDGKKSLIAAALLHDVGHFLHDYAVACATDGIDSQHEDVGADYLARFFPAAVTEPVRLHVAAKRYLCAAEPDYFSGLSPASVRSLELQGGPMSDEERATFDQNPHAEDAILLRRCDEGAKVPDLRTPDVEAYRDLLQGLVVA